MSDEKQSLDWELISSSTAPPASAVTAAAGLDNEDWFRGKTIVITGAGGQLGRAGCVYFAARGARIVALDLDAAALESTFQEACCAASSSVVLCDFKPYLCNVTDAARVDAVMNHVVQRNGSIDFLWNNAGYQGCVAPILEQDAADFANVMNINVTGMFIVLQAVAKHMVKAQNDILGAAIVNTASVAGLRGTPAMVGYASSKAAVMSMTICAAKELAVHNIRVNAISPALIGPGKLWERQNELHAAVGAPYFGDTPETVASSKIASVPMKRLGTAQEVVKSVAFLLSDEASYTTGINLTVDGGMSAQL